MIDKIYLHRLQADTGKSVLFAKGNDSRRQRSLNIGCHVSIDIIDGDMNSGFFSMSDCRGEVLWESNDSNQASSVQSI